MSDKMFHRILVVIAAITCLGLFICSQTNADSKKQKLGNSELSLISSSADGVVLEFYPAKPGILEVDLCELEGKLLAKVTRRHSGKTIKVELFAQINTKDMANYYIRYRFAANEQFRKRSLMHVGEILETIVLGQREYIAGSTPLIRILVKDKAAGIPVAGANVSVELTDKGKVISMFTAKTDSAGQVGAKLYMPDEEIKSAKLKITVKSKTATDKIEETIKIVSPLKTLLTTDKPLYQPGQTIHIRALTLALSDKKPAGNSDVTFEVEDAKGNKVFKKLGKTDKFGISHTDFVLGTELNMGTYRIRAIVAGMKEEKTVNVEKYVLPKFKVKLKTDRNFYQPGETVKGDIQVDYFFGKPVNGGKVEIKCSKFDVNYQDFQIIEGKTDESGHYSFTVTLPKHFVGQPLEAGKASAKFEIKVTDTADHAEKLTRNVAVTANPIIIAAVPESGELIAGLENKVYIVTTYADSTPASCDVTWYPERGNKRGDPLIIKTDAAGFAELTLGSDSYKSPKLSLTAKDAKGNKGKADITLKVKTKVDDDTVLVRTDKSLYKAGDKIDLTVVSTRKNGTAYIDFIKNGQTYLTRTLDLQDGNAKDSVTADNTLSGTVQVNAYVIGANGVIVRDRRLIIIDPANDLKIDISSDSETYLPGTNAKINFKVTGKNGKGVASALGVMVVDEAVFALQEMQPGLEKVYFYLEKEIAKPRYEIHGYDLDGCIIPPTSIPLPELRKMQVRRDTAAKVLLASAKGAGDYPLHVNTYIQNNKSYAFNNKMAQVLMKRYQKVQTALGKFAKKHKKLLGKKLDKGIDIALLVKEGFLTLTDITDPWGTKMKLSGTWCKGCQNYHNHRLSSAGIDGKWGTTDDCSVPAYNAHGQRGKGKGRMRLGRGGAFFGDAKDERVLFALEAKAVDKPMAMAGAEIMEGELRIKKQGLSAKPAGPRIRQYFPETLYFNPSLITGPGGSATLNIPLADSITTWRMSCMASSMTGQLGSTTAGINVFQDFFVDIDFPVALTQNDQVSVPVAIYNYLKTNQKIELEVKTADWFELKTLAKKTVTLKPSEITVAYFPIIAKKIGHQKFTVIARGTSKSDAVARSVEIVPDGKENLVSFSGRLEGDVSHTITIPKTAIDDASKIFIKVYPGVLSQIAEGLDKILRMPGGCFEQTSSATYPNILVLDYMKSTGKITPALQMKAEGFINNGYQRLLSFEVDGGGFEWFGRSPAHRILTAYGLMEFYDMSKVYDVDPAVISRTQKWLAKCQEKDGSYKPSKGGIAEGAINKFTTDLLRNTAYITWALAATGYDGPEVQKGVKYIKNNLDRMKDVYTRVLVVNALATIDPKDDTTLDTLRTLHDMRIEEGDSVHWKLTGSTPTHGTGRSGNIEVTGLAVQAFMLCGRESGTVTKAVNFLVKNKDAYGTWQSTQATIQALKGMLMAESAGSAGANAKIALEINGKDAATIEVNDQNSDLLQLVDLKDQTAAGQNNITLKFKGEGSLLYQVVGRYYMPYRTAGVKAKEPMTITVDYDRTKLVTDDIINVSATVQNNRPGTAKMVIVDLGLAPGFTLIPDKLNKMVKNKTIEKYSTTGRQIIVYLRELSHGQPLKIEYQLLAKYPLKAKTAKSTVYEYYNPDVKNETTPIELTVAKAKK